VAYAGASVDGRNEGQKSLNVDVPEESLGMARLTDCLVTQLQFFFPGLYYEPQIWTAFNNIGRKTKGWHHSLGRAPTIDGNNCACGMWAHTSYMQALGTAGRHCILREIVRMTRGCQRELIRWREALGRVGGSDGVDGVDGCGRCLRGIVSVISLARLHKMPHNR
jgi:hypothetical protein